MFYLQFSAHMKRTQKGDGLREWGEREQDLAGDKHTLNKIRQTASKQKQLNENDTALHSSAAFDYFIHRHCHPHRRLELGNAFAIILALPLLCAVVCTYLS